MDYSTPSAVQALCRRAPKFTDTSTVTTSQVETIIDQHEAELNVALAPRGFVVPVTSPAWLVTWLEKLTTEGSAAAVLKAIFQDVSGPNSEASWAEWARRYREGLAWIRDQKNEMTYTAVAEVGGGGVASWATDHAGNDSVLNSAAEPPFSMTTEW